MGQVAIDDKKRIETLWREGQAAFQAGDLETATSRFQALTQVDPNNADALHRLGQIAYFRNQYPLALRLVTEALKRRNHFPVALNTLGGVLMKMKEWDAARDTLKGALRQRPRDASALSNLGTVYLETGDLEKAEKYLRRALDVRPTHAIAWNNLGNVFRNREQWSTAQAYYQKALSQDANYQDALRNLGNVCTKLGELDRAVEYYHRALDLDPLGVDSLTGLASAKKFTAEDPDLQRFRVAAEDAGNWSRNQRIGFFFAWGKALDDAKCFDDAYVCFENGNRQRAEERPYDARAFHAFVDEIQSTFPEERIERLQAAGSLDESPVFILGMPRSGTTLTEQILASHPQVLGAGELTAWKETMDGLLGGELVDHYGSWLRELDETQLRRAAEGYLTHRPDAQGAVRVTDKMPGNFIHLGLIRLAFPKARIIHCVRNPVDVCLSCFQKDFSQGQNFSYGQEWLGSRFSEYARLMEYWRTVFPGQWLDVPYEQVVSDPEYWARRIVDFAGLPWDDACIDFHRAERAVHTASVWQVRQPVYKSAVERWRRYESHLEPLLRTLGEYRDWHLRFTESTPQT
ncbi:sulfotransferase [Ectothiorhodospiraceae bacterium WFHF3C12]|nr:sulfotransferase [Ectothiorhodospiraceae bacterium WFHF3C12]